MTDSQHVQDAFDRAYAGGPARHRDKSREQGKLPVRERVERLLDDGSFTEDALLANWEAEGLGADGVVTGMGAIAGRTVALMANDPTVKAGSWGPKTVEKILRIQEAALANRVPMVYLVDSAGARITEQLHMFPGRRPAGRRRAARARAHPRRREQAVGHARAARRRRRRGVLPRGPQALGEGADRRLRAPRGPGGRHRRQPAQVQGRGALRRLRRQGR